MSKKDIERMEKHRDEKNPYIGAALFASVLALILAIVPWNYFGDGIGTSLPMRIVIVVFALLGDYHVTKAKQVNNLIYSKYGFRIKANIVSLANCLSIFVTVNWFICFVYTIGILMPIFIRRKIMGVLFFKPIPRLAIWDIR